MLVYFICHMSNWDLFLMGMLLAKPGSDKKYEWSNNICKHKQASYFSCIYKPEMKRKWPYEDIDLGW